MEEEEALVPLMRNRKTKSKNESSIKLEQNFKIYENSSSQKISDKILTKFGVQNYRHRKKLYCIIGSEVREIYEFLLPDLHYYFIDSSLIPMLSTPCLVFLSPNMVSLSG